MLMPIVYLLIWIACSVLFAVMGLFALRKILPRFAMSENADFMVSAVAIVGTLVSVLLGFIVSTAADHYKDLEGCVDSEATAVAEIFRLSRALPEEKGHRLQLGSINYCEAIVNKEWTAMKKRELSEEVTAAFLELNGGILDIRPQNLQESNIQTELLRSLREVSNYRRERIISVRSHSFIQMLPMLLICSVVLLVISYLFTAEKPSKLQILLIALIGIVLGANFGILDLLDHPFNGDASISPEQFKINEETMKRFVQP